MDGRVAIIAEESERLAAVVDRAPDLAADVPSCPEWRVFDLVAHVGRVQRFWADVVRTGRAPDIEPHPPPPDAEGPELAEWYRACADDLVDAVRSADPGSRCWTWWGEPATAAAVARHQVQEVSVHRWDTESAVGTPASLRPDVAHDGVDEFLAITLGDALDTLSYGVDLVATDTGGTWRAGPPGDAAATVRATASDLVLLLHRRIQPERVLVEGHNSAVAALLALTDDE